MHSHTIIDTILKFSIHSNSNVDLICNRPDTYYVPANRCYHNVAEEIISSVLKLINLFAGGTVCISVYTGPECGWVRVYYS
jgi:hypothetical protein